jgi:pimeloyl-ACP methyl ester carboxylesterase
MTNKVNIVLVHGAWADGSSWSKVIPILRKAGYNVVASQNNLESLPDDAETVHRLADAQEGPTLLVGHSYGGAIITEAAHLCPNVVGLVYIAGFGLDEGESINTLSAGAEPPPGASSVRPNKYGYLWIDKEMFPANFCQDVEAAEAQIMAITQRPITLKCFGDKITNAGWKNLPSWYQVSENDRMIPPPAEHLMADRMNAKMISLPASHASLVSHPEEIANFILRAAKEVVETGIMEAAMN